METAPKSQMNVSTFPVEKLGWLLIFIMAVFLAFAIYPSAQLDNDMSRFAAIESLVERGTWIIDESPFLMKPPRGKRPATPIVDRVVMEGHSYSTKPPVMTFLMAGEYWLLKNLFGLDFSDESERPFLVWILTFTFVALPFLGIAWFFLKSGPRFIDNPLLLMTGMIILLFGNQLWGFSRTLNNHVPSGFFLFFSMVQAVSLVHGKIQPRPYHFIFIGLCTGLLPTFDLPGLFFCAPLFFYLFYFFPKQTLSWFLLGAIPPLALHFALTWSITGDFIPIYMKKELYHYKGSYWDKMGGFDALEEPKWLYFLHLSIGRKGLFSLFPVLVLSLVGFCRSFVKQDGCPLKWEMRTLVFLTAFWMLFYTFQTNNYGGMCYGFRWFMFFTPALAFFSILAMKNFLTGWRWIFLCLLIAVSCYSGWQCSLDPWTANEEWTTRFLGKWTF